MAGMRLDPICFEPSRLAGAPARATARSAAPDPPLLRYAAFVGSRRKAETLRRDLVAEGAPEAALARVKAPAGLDIHAITSEEIALSILAELIGVRRGVDRADASLSPPAGASS
jgi:xanthine/CO dehydrogenase XdhC/CoxF family maturation factor